MHVALVIYGDLEATSGGFRYDRRLVAALRERGDTVDVISLPWRRYPRGVLDGLSRTIRSRLDRPVDVLLQDELCHPSLWYHNAKLTRPGTIVSLVHHLRSDDPGERFRALFRPVERRYLASVDATITTSAFTRRRAERLSPSVADRPSLVARPAGRVEGAALRPAQVAARAYEGPLRIAFVGNLVPRKDPLTLIAAVDQGLRNGADWELTIVGSHEVTPRYAARVVDAAEKRAVGQRVRFTGELERAQLRAIFERSHLCCVPSRYEAFGMVYLEAMEFGVVPIASARGGAREFVDHGRNGLLVEPGSPETIARLLHAVDSDRDRLSALAENAVETARSHPTWAESMASVRSFLQQVAPER